MKTMRGTAIEENVGGNEIVSLFHFLTGFFGAKFRDVDNMITIPSKLISVRKMKNIII